MDNEVWEKAKKQKFDTVVVVADGNDVGRMDLGDSSSAAAAEGPPSPWSSMFWAADYSGLVSVDAPSSEVEEDDWVPNDEIIPDYRIDIYSSSDDDDDWKPKDEAGYQKLQDDILEPLKKAQKASLEMYDRLEKEFKASSQEWRWKEWKERVDRLRTILKEDPEYRMWEDREYKDLMLVVNDYNVFKNPYHGLRVNINPEDGELVQSAFYLNAHSFDKKRDEQCVDFQKVIENNDPAKEDPDPSSVLSKALEIAKPFNLLSSKDVKRAVDDYLRKELCKKNLCNIRVLLKQYALKNSSFEDVYEKISAISGPVFPGVGFLLVRLSLLDDEKAAMREIDDEYERNLNYLENNVFTRADYLKLKLRLAKELDF